jgi:hypothetical protein
MRSNQWVAAAMGTVAAFGVAAGARADTSRSVSVAVEDRAGVSDRKLDQAKGAAAAIYHRAGVSIVWTTHASDAAVPDVMLVILPTASASEVHASDDSMGLTPNGDGVRGRVAYVFYDRVMTFSEAGRVDLPAVLGAVLAHELGHLLLPVNAHSRDGVMRADWDLAFVPRLGVGVLNFSAEQARLLRARLATREP